MRRSALALACLLAAVHLTGCTPRETPVEDRPENLVVSVFLDREATKPETAAVEARLRDVPDIRGLAFVTRQQAYEKFRTLYRDRPDLVDPVKVEHMPESFEFTLPDRAAFERTYRGPLRGDLRQLDAVDTVVFRGKKPQASMDECVTNYRGPVATQVVLEIRVFLTDDTSTTEKQAIESRLRAVPGATDVRLRTREEAYELFKETYQDVKPEVVASAKPKDLPEALVLTVADRPAILRANDEKLDEQICRMPGVDQVFVPPKPLASRKAS